MAIAGAGILPSEATAGSGSSAAEGSHDRSRDRQSAELWQTYQALGQLCEQVGQREQARSAYTNALRVIDEVANRLQDQEIKHTLLVARPVEEIRVSLTRLQSLAM